MRKGNMARGRERCGGAKFGVGRIERAHTSEEKTKTWNDSLTTTWLEIPSLTWRQNYESETSFQIVLPAPAPTPIH